MSGYRTSRFAFDTPNIAQKRRLLDQMLVKHY
jgi:hypothetical protein